MKLYTLILFYVENELYQINIMLEGTGKMAQGTRVLSV